MKSVSLACLVASLLLGGLASAGSQDSEININTRYTVEAVVVSGGDWTTNLAADRDDQKISRALRKDILALIGEKLNPPVLNDIAKRLRKEFHARTVEHHVLRGKSPEYVRVVFDIQLRPTRFDVSVPKFLYSSAQSWSGAVEGTATVGHNGFTAGLLSDGDDLLERYTGLVARYENTQLGSDRVRLRFQFESYHEQWNRNTSAGAGLEAAAADTSGIYRTRQNFEPVVTLALARPLTLSLGTSFERFREESPVRRMEGANALVAGLHYHRRLEGAESQHDLDAGYDLRAATRVFASDFVYSRHRWEFRYMLTRGKNVVLDDLTAGMIAGRAPLFERFVLGNGSTLRGWNKYDMDPLGGNRMIHNSVEYRYGVFQVFYDSGAIWDAGQGAVARQSAGVGLRQGGFSAMVAFPLREGHIDPIFMVGMNY